MLSSQEQISILIHLSKVDNKVAEEEYKFILSIAGELGINKESIDQLINNPLSIPKLKNLPRDDKYDYLFNLVRMMKIDGKIYPKEIIFCEKIALSLGFKPGVIAKLSPFIYRDSLINSNRDLLESIANRYIIPLNEDNN